MTATAATTTAATADTREQARRAYRVSVEAGAGLSGKTLGEVRA
jgi:hypothetical protein